MKWISKINKRLGYGYFEQERERERDRGEPFAGVTVTELQPPLHMAVRAVSVQTKNRPSSPHKSDEEKGASKKINL